MRDPVPADSFVEVAPYTGWLADDDPNIRCTPSWHADRSRRNFAGSGFGNTSGFDPGPPPAGGGTLQPGAARDFSGLGAAGRIRADSERIPDEDQAATRLGGAVPPRLLEFREKRLSGARRWKASDGTGLAV